MSSITNIQPSAELLQLLTTEQAWQYRIVPKEKINGQLSFYSDGTNTSALQHELEILFGKKIVLESLPADELNKTLSKLYRKDFGQSKQAKKIHVSPDSDEFLNDLINEAKELNSSDIHIESYENTCRVRIRIDGQLVERYIIEKHKYPALISKIKVDAQLDISEKRLPQDGRIFYKKHGEKFDIRVSIMPGMYGEKIVMRLLRSNIGNIDITSLGFSEKDLERYKEEVKKPHGIILISGPTGSGKTTTLYATLKLLNSKSVNIQTIEDPIEYTLEGINQAQLKENIGLTFAAALRSFLRQDPDIIMVGEIRDQETANMAVRASLTGHLVLSTIHTNSAWGIVSRLADMGVEPFLLGDTLNMAVAQRLVRLLCPTCKEKKSFKENLYPSSFKTHQSVSYHFTPNGCEQCYYTGYKGRKAIYEVIPIDEQLRNEIKIKSLTVKDILKQKEIKTLSENAFELFALGETSLQEVYMIL